MCGRGLQFVRVISDELGLPATTGEKNLWNHDDDTLSMGVVEDQKFEAAGFKNLKAVPTEAMGVRVLMMVGKPTFGDVLGEFGYPTRFSPELTQHQGLEFVRLHREQLHPEPGIGTFMLMHGRVGTRITQVMVSIYRGDPKFGALGIGFHEFSCDTRWLDERQYRLVIPSSSLVRRIPSYARVSSCAA